MPIDQKKIDEAVLALLYLNVHAAGSRAWKVFDWDALNRLHEKGFVTDHNGRAKALIMTEQGLNESERLFRKLFVRKQPGRPKAPRENSSTG
jgi:predicted GNAT superfamily acetyltransferase